jgi:hypothetical protein
MIDDVASRLENPVRQPVVAHKLPNVLLRVQLRALRRQRNQSDVRRNHKLARGVPTGLIDQQRGVSAGRDGCGDLGKVQAHGGGIASRQHQGSSLALLGADGAENVRRGGALIPRRRWPRATQRPAAGDLVLLPNPRLIAEPNLYAARLDLFVARDFLQNAREGFLKCSIAPSA